MSEEDWTRSPDGRSNNSENFNRLSAHVESLIRNSAHDLICGRTQKVSRLIVAQLAHVYGMVPTKEIEP